MTDEKKRDKADTVSSERDDNIQVACGETLLLCPTSPRFKHVFKQISVPEIDRARELLGVSRKGDKEPRPCRPCPPDLNNKLPSAADLSAKDPSVRGEALKLAYSAAREYVRGNADTMKHWVPFLNAYLELAKARISGAFLGDVVVQDGGTLAISRLTQFVQANSVKLYGSGRIVCYGPVTFRATTFQGNL